MACFGGCPRFGIDSPRVASTASREHDPEWVLLLRAALIHAGAFARVQPSPEHKEPVRLLCKRPKGITSPQLHCKRLRAAHLQP